MSLIIQIIAGVLSNALYHILVILVKLINRPSKLDGLLKDLFWKRLYQRPDFKVLVDKSSLARRESESRALMELPTQENRLITTLFVDISGFTALSIARSSEALFEMMQDCFQRLVGIVDSYEGSISGFRGDGLLALFGAPILHENDAERAILAALDMRSVVRDQQLEVSIGINTGSMTVGEIQTQLHEEYTAYGRAINLAERLQEAAQPGQILVGASTYHLVQGSFDFETLSSLSLKGFPQPVAAYAVQQAKMHPKKLRGIEGLHSRMVGRERDFEELKEAAGQWLQGLGQIVSIVGEAGVGKSRLVQELLEILDKRQKTKGERQKEMRLSIEFDNLEFEGILSLKGRCISIGKPISYWPFVDILRAYFGLSEEDDIASIAHKVTESVTNLMPQDADETLPLLGNLLSIHFGNELDDKLKFAGSEQVRYQTLMRLRDLFVTLAKQQPLLLILEDLHWADDLSLDLVSLLMDELTDTPLMLLCVYRPEKEHRIWQLGSQARRKCPDRYTEITLDPLSDRQSGELIESLLEIGFLPESTKNMILRKSEGNPLFIEEVVRSLIEQRLLYLENGCWKARSGIADINVPDTIQSVVLARVDRLQAGAKYVLQSASVIGRFFGYRLLKSLLQQGWDIDRYLIELKERELIYTERTAPELEYAFKHTLTQEAVYLSILKKRRREFHHLVALEIEKLYRERVGEYYDVLAYHYSESDNVAKSVEYLLKAGERAKLSYANESSISHFQKALEMLERYGMERDDWKLEALSGLGEVYQGMGEADQATKKFQKAIALAEKMKLPSRQLAKLYAWVARAFWWQSKFDEVIRYGERGLETLGNDTECPEAALINARIGSASFNRGEYERFAEYTRKNTAFIRKLVYSEELRIAYECIIEYAYIWKRDSAMAWEWSKHLETLAEDSHDSRGLASAWRYQGVTSQQRGDYAKALPLYQKSLNEFERIGDSKYASWCHSDILRLMFSSGATGEAVKYLPIFLESTKQVGNERDMAVAHRLSGMIALYHHYWYEAILNFQKSLEIWHKVKNPIQIAQTCTLLGKAYLKKRDYHCAVECFQYVASEEFTAVQDDWYRRDRYLNCLADSLDGIDEAYMALDKSEELSEFCASLTKRYPQTQLYMKTAKTSTEFRHLVFADNFKTEQNQASWSWVDEFRDCKYRVAPENGLEIHAVNGRDLFRLNLSAPRLMREISGDFAVEMCMSSISHEKPQIGGLLVWKDKDNFLRFERGVGGENEMRLHGYVGGEWKIAGRGPLKTKNDEETHLRLERNGGKFSAYCSVDAKNWLMCGYVKLPIDDPIQIGINAIGMIDRTTYCGSFRAGTATLFRNFRLWTRI